MEEWFEKRTALLRSRLLSVLDEELGALRREVAEELHRRHPTGEREKEREREDEEKKERRENSTHLSLLERKGERVTAMEMEKVRMGSVHTHLHPHQSPVSLSPLTPDTASKKGTDVSSLLGIDGTSSTDTVKQPLVKSLSLSGRGFSVPSSRMDVEKERENGEKKEKGEKGENDPSMSSTSSSSIHSKSRTVTVRTTRYMMAAQESISPPDTDELFANMHGLSSEVAPESPPPSIEAVSRQLEEGGKRKREKEREGNSAADRSVEKEKGENEEVEKKVKFTNSVSEREEEKEREERRENEREEERRSSAQSRRRTQDLSPHSTRALSSIPSTPTTPDPSKRRGTPPTPATPTTPFTPSSFSSSSTTTSTSTTTTTTTTTTPSRTHKELTHTDANALMKQATNAFKEGRNEDAIEGWSEIIIYLKKRKSSQVGKFLKNRALAYSRLSLFDLAASDLDACLEMGHRMFEVEQAYFRLEKKRKRFDEALRHLEASLKVCPKEKREEVTEAVRILRVKLSREKESKVEERNTSPSPSTAPLLSPSANSEKGRQVLSRKPTMVLPVSEVNEEALTSPSSSTPQKTKASALSLSSSSPHDHHFARRGSADSPVDGKQIPRSQSEPSLTADLSSPTPHSHTRYPQPKLQPQRKEKPKWDPPTPGGATPFLCFTSSGGVPKEYRPILSESHFRELFMRIPDEMALVAQTNISTSKLQDELRTNGIKLAGRRDDLIRRKAEAKLLGVLPRCPLCPEKGHLRRRGGDGMVECEGSFDEVSGRFQKCVFTCPAWSSKLRYTEWKESS